MSRDQGSNGFARDGVVPYVSGEDFIATMTRIALKPEQIPTEVTGSSDFLTHTRDAGHTALQECRLQAVYWGLEAA